MRRRPVAPSEDRVEEPTSTRAGRARATLAVAAVVALVAGVVALVVTGSGYVRAVPVLGDGAAWLAGPKGGLHVNGATGQVDGTRNVACGTGAAPCTWVQGGPGAYLVDGDGKVTVVDTGRADVTAPVALPAAGAQLVTSGSAATYAVDLAGGTVHVLDPEDLHEQAAVTVGGPLTDAVGDGRGAVWVVDRQGQAAEVDPAGRLQRWSVAGAGADLALGSHAGGVLVLDRATAELTRLDANGVTHRARVDRSDVTNLLPGRDLPPGPVWLADRRDGTVLAVDLDAGTTRTLTTLHSVGDLQPPLSVGARVAVFDRQLREVRLFDPVVADGRPASEDPPLSGAGTAFVKDGFLYVNDPAGFAVVIDPAGRRHEVDKGLAVSRAVGTGGASGAGDKAGPGKVGTKPVVTAPKPAASKPAAHKPAHTSAPVIHHPVPAAPAPALPAGARPGTPARVVATPGDGAAVVTWPVVSGNPTYYQVTGSDGRTIRTGTQAGCSTVARTCTVTGLTNGTTYTFRVTAVNARGNGVPSEPSNPVTPTAGTPKAVTDVQATADPKTGAVTVTWTAPADPVTASFTITPEDVARPYPQLAKSVPAGTHTVTFTGLTLGTAYRFTVVAVSAGKATSPPATSNEVTPTGPPGAMGPITATVPNGGLGATTATLSWAAVADGGATVTYVVKDGKGTQVGTTADTTFDLTGLTPGSDSTYTVTPTSDLGSGAPGSVEVVSYADLSGGPQPGVVINLTKDVTATAVAPGTGGGPTTYRFTYTLTNQGLAACLPAVRVGITADVGGADLSVSQPFVCLRSGGTFTVDLSASLDPGSYTIDADWTDGKGGVHGYGTAGTVVPHPLVVT